MRYGCTEAAVDLRWFGLAVEHLGRCLVARAARRRRIQPGSQRVEVLGRQPLRQHVARQVAPQAPVRVLHRTGLRGSERVASRSRNRLRRSSR